MPAATEPAQPKVDRRKLVAGWLDCKDDDARRAYVKANPDIVAIYSEARNFVTPV